MTSQYQTSKRPVIESLEQRSLLSADLSGAVSIVAPGSHQLKPGHSMTVSLTIKNNSASKVSGNLSTEMGISTSADGSAPLADFDFKKPIHLGANGHATFRVSVKVPLGFAPGAYYAVADVDPNNAFGDTNLSNNLAVSSNAVTLLSQFPDIRGTWSGVVVVQKGLGKGTRGTQTDTFLTENLATGAFTFSGTNLFAGAAPLVLGGSGTISTKGVFQNSGADIPADAIGTFTGKGKLVGRKLTIAYKNALNSGTITLTKTA